MKLVAFLGRYCGQPMDLVLSKPSSDLRRLAEACGELIREENDPARSRGR